MKKLSFILFALLAVTLFTACGDDDERKTEQTLNMVINSRTIDGDNVVFSRGSAGVKINYTDMFIKFTADYTDADGQKHTLTTSDMKLYIQSNTVYSFNNMASSTYSGINNFKGYIDLATGMTWYSFDAGSSHVVCTSQLLYAYSTTTVTNPDNGNHINHEQSAYLFAIDDKGETCTMKIGNFIPNINGSAVVSEIQYNNLNVTPTLTGYIISAAELESSYKGFHTITDLNITLDDQCQLIDGSFKCGDLDFTISGKLFPLNNL